MSVENHGYLIPIELIDEFKIDYDDFDFLANIIFSDMVIYNLRVAGDIAFSKNKEGTEVLVVDLENPDILLIEETEQDFRRISLN